MRQKKENGFLYLFGAVILEWLISMLVRGAAEFVYIYLHYDRIQTIVDNPDKLMDAAMEMAVELNQYAVEITVVTAVIMIPILWRMYRKDKKRSQFTMGANAISDMPRENWWQKKLPFGVKECGIVVLMGISACIAVNNLIMLSGVTALSEAYQVTSANLYRSPFLLQIIGLGIIVPVAEEMLYRGMLLRRMRESVPAGMALVFTSVFFGINHGNLVQFLFAAFMSILMGLVFEYFRSLKAPIVFHIAVNLTSILISWTGILVWTFQNIVRVGAVTVVCAGVGAAAFQKIKSMTEQEHA